MSHGIASRKSDHITLCAVDDVAFRNASTLLSDVKLVHEALPDIAVEDIDMSSLVLGKRLRAPIIIAAMTGGTEEAGRINRELAAIAELRGYGFGLGSQRAMHANASWQSTYEVRSIAPSTLVLGNLGVVQARSMRVSEIESMLASVGADAICLHMNPAMEIVQPGGDSDFRGGRETITRLVRELGVPVIAKETGCGIAPRTARVLRECGVRHVDVSGAGGTSWVGVETKRAEKAGDARAIQVGSAFWDWGVPTAASVALLSPLGFDTIIATGGIKTGMDVARAIVLGATAAGIARPVLQALHHGGRDAALSYLDGVEAELRAAMLLTGSSTLEALRAAPRVITGELATWLDQLGGGVSPAEHAEERTMIAFDEFHRSVRHGVEARLGSWLDEKKKVASSHGPDATALVDAVESLTMRGGKRFRAGLLAAAFEACGGGTWETVLMAAVSIELFQTYLLIHDDWMDADDTRRGGPTAHVMLRDRFASREQGDSGAILAGDLACAFAQKALLELPLGIDRVHRASLELTRAHEDVIYGQILDVRATAGDRATVEKVHMLKTASYSVLAPVRMGALLAGADTDVLESLANFAVPLGIAFQLRDDLLGTFGDPAITGKPVGNDLVRGKHTAVVAELDLRGSLPPAIGRVLGVPTASAGDVKAAIDELVRTGAKRRVEERIHDLAATSLAALDHGPIPIANQPYLRAAVSSVTERAL